MEKDLKQDVYNNKEKFNEKYDLLKENKLYTHPQNNHLIKIYVDAKIKGNYKRLIYDVNKPDSTCLVTMEKLLFLENYFNKPLSQLTQTDIDQLQTDFDNNNITTQHKTKKKRPISPAYKKDLIKHLKQFWKFYRLHNKEEHQQETPDITEYLRVKNPDKNKEIDYLEFEDFLKILNTTKNQQQKTFIALGFETASRPIELIKVKRKHLKYDPDKNLWTIKLPNEKGKSTNKARVELLLYSNEIDKYLKTKDFDQEDYLFTYTYGYFRKLIYQLGKHALKRNITPKILRKSRAMHMLKLGYSETLIKQICGWDLNTTALKNYVSTQIVSIPDHLRKAQTSQQYKTFEDQITELKNEQQKLQNQNQAREEYILQMLNSLKQDVEKNKELNFKNQAEKEQLLRLYQSKKLTK
jgi:integrase